jgi:predicted RNase H-like nuclease (RuvC/YqgF family)
LPIFNCQLKRRGRTRFKLAIGIWQLAMGSCLVVASAVQAQGNTSSLSESKIENAAQPAAAEALLQENEQLQKQLSIAQESLKALTSSLAESNAQAEELRRKYSDLELRMEALGLASANKDKAKLEQRLLAAVSDLQLAQKERNEYRDQMLRLNEAVLCYLRTSQGGDAKARMDLEAQLRSINALITKSASAPDVPEPSLMDGNVISVKEEWSFVVGNLGEKQGVKIGMPMRVMRDDRKIATLRVVDVRQKICGAVIQEMDSKKEQIKVGDRLQVDAQPDVSLK